MLTENNTVPTPENVFRNKCSELNSDITPHDAGVIQSMMHEYAVLFARHHVSEALQAANKNSKVAVIYGEGRPYIMHEVLFNDELHNECVACADCYSILNAYPLDKIV